MCPSMNRASTSVQTTETIQEVDLVFPIQEVDLVFPIQEVDLVLPIADITPHSENCTKYQMFCSGA